MSEKAVHIKCYPWVEIFTFAFIAICSLLILFAANVSMWFSIPAIIFFYFITMGDSCYFSIKNNTFNIGSFNILFKGCSIEKGSIINIRSIEISQDDSYYVFGAPHFSRKRYYEVRYVNNEQERKTIFSISNRKKGAVNPRRA